MVYYPTCNAQAPYCYLWTAPLYSIFPHYLINGTIFEGKKVTEHKIRVFIFSAISAWSNWILWIEFSKNTKKKKIHENQSNGSPVVPFRRTDIQVVSSLSQLCERGLKIPLLDPHSYTKPNFLRYYKAIPLQGGQESSTAIKLCQWHTEKTCSSSHGFDARHGQWRPQQLWIQPTCSCGGCCPL